MDIAFWLDAGVGAGALLAFALILNGARHVRHRRFMRGGANGFGGLVFGLIVAVVLLVGLNLLTYERFTAETPVADVYFRKLAPQRYAVTLVRPDGSASESVLDGDEWQLDARVIKWKGIATLIGLKPLYRLERLSGRYESVRETQQKPGSAVALAQEPGLSLWSAAHKEARWLPLVDASYGSATYLPMADGAEYRVTLSTTGLLARPANGAAEEAVRNWE
jgi:hypothetical protein